MSQSSHIINASEPEPDGARLFYESVGLRWEHPERSQCGLPDTGHSLVEDRGPRYQPLWSAAHWTSALLCVAVVVNACAAISSLSERALVTRALGGQLVTPTALAANDARQGTIALLQLLILLSAGTAFLVWFGRAYANLTSLDVAGLRYSPGWALGAWFVPLLGFIRPKQIADDLWRASDPDVHNRSWRGRPVPLFVHLWWISFASGNALGYLAAQDGAGDLANLQRFSSLHAGSEFLSMIAGGLALVFVRRVTMRQEARNRSLASLRRASNRHFVN